MMLSHSTAELKLRRNAVQCLAESYSFNSTFRMKTHISMFSVCGMRSAVCKNTCDI